MSSRIDDMCEYDFFVSNLTRIFLKVSKSYISQLPKQATSEPYFPYILYTTHDKSVFVTKGREKALFEIMDEI